MKIRRYKNTKSRRAALQALGSGPHAASVQDHAARLGALLLTGSFAVAHVPVYAAGGALPIPCAGNSCLGSTGKPLGFDLLNTHSTLTTGANSLIINQNANSAIFNWQSFNIAAGNSVQFIQPSNSSVALNRIFDANVTTISGNLKSNGQVYLINPNGILFGTGANVNVGGLIASTSNINDSRITAGLLSDPTPTDPVFTANIGTGSTLTATSIAESPAAGAGANPSIVVQSGASLYAAGRDTSGAVVSAGRVFLFAPTVENAGKITVDGGGQVILGAGSDVYLGSSTDVSLRGLLIEVAGNAGPVTVDPSGNITVARGNITLMGLAVNQAGTLTATSALDENGSIRLIARVADPSLYFQVPSNDPTVLLPITQTGVVNVESGSRTTVVLDPTDTATAPLNDPTAAATQSTILIQGSAVNIGGSGAGTTVIQAHGGDVSVTARSAGLSSGGTSNGYNLGSGALLGATDLNDPSGGGIINVGSNATIDVSGLQNVPVDSSREWVNISRLTTTNLADAPYQRSGFLLGQSVYVNLLDVPSWLNVTSLQAAVASTQAERNAVGGEVSLLAEGAVNLAKGSTVNVSGGSTYLVPSVGRMSQLLTASGAVVPISNASENVQYVGFADQGSYTSVDTREGVNTSVSWETPVYTSLGGYSLGQNAGTVQIYAPMATLAGTLLGNATATSQQRSSPPLGGALQIGNNTAVIGGSTVSDLDEVAAIQRGSILLAAGNEQLVQGFSAGVNAALINPGAPAIDVNTTSLSAGGFTRLDLTSDGAIELAPGSPLNLGPNGVFAARANLLEIDSSISAPGGSISIAQRPITPIPVNSTTLSEVAFRNTQSLVQTSDQAFDAVSFAPGTHLSVAGLWTNDETLPAGAVPVAPVVTSGGSISISAAEVDVRGASFDVSAGAWLAQNAAFTGGDGGSISISALPSAPSVYPEPSTPPLLLGSDFSSRIAGFGVGSGSGGALTIGSWSLQLGQGVAADPASVLIDPAVGSRGFQTFNFNAYATVAASTGTNFAPVPYFIENSPGLRQAGSNASLLAVASPEVLPPGSADPVKIALNANGVGVGLVDVSPGAQINAGIEGSITLSGFDEVLMDGALRAQAGSIALALGNADPTQDYFTYSYLQSRSIQLGPQSLIDISGVGLLTTNTFGITSGSVLGAGTITLDAPLGAVALDAGSRILANGVAATVDIPVGANRYQAQTVASAGGTVEISATTGIFVEGSINAKGGNAGANGGSLSVALEAVEPNTSYSDPNVETELGLAENLNVSSLLPALAVDQSSFALTGAAGGPGTQGVISPATINKSGFEQVWLQSADTISLTQTLTLGGAPNSASNYYSLNSLVLSAQAIDLAAGINAVVSAGYLALGPAAQLNSNTNGFSNFQTSPPVGSTGTASLNVNAQQLDLVGNLALQGVAQTNLNVIGDVRGLGIPGVFFPGDQQPSRSIGSLSYGGNLVVNAAQLYPATQTDFTFSAADPATGVFQFSSIVLPSVVLPPLSAGGSLTFNVTNFQASGRIEAPLGAITINSGSITLEPGGTLSVTGVGLVPYGTVDNGSTWTYGVPPGNSVPIDPYTLASTAGTVIPAKGITLNAPAGSVETLPGSVISVAGGGDVQGIDFVSGPSGTIDYSLNFPFGNSTPNPFFALVPSRGSAPTPFDPQVFSDLVLDAGLSAAGAARYTMGETLTVGTGSAIPAGTYTVLPVRYALLPGAFAVEQVSGYSNLAPSSSVAMPDGSVIVAGKLGFADSGTGASLWSGFQVYSEAQFHNFAEFDVYRGDQFFATAAANAGQVAQRLGKDGGQLQIAADAIELAGTIDAAPEGSGRGAEIAIDAPAIVVADSAGTASGPQATLQLDAGTLSGLGAETLILGALDLGSGSSMVLGSPVVSQSITVSAQKSALSAGQLVLDSATITVAPGSTIVAAQNQTPPTTSIQVSGDGAGLFVGNNAGVPVWTRTGASPAGTATIGTLNVGIASTGAGAALISGPSVLFDATAEQNFGSAFTLNAVNLDTSSALVNLGTVPTGTSGLNLSGTLLAAFESAQNLRISSAGGIDVYGSATLGQIGAGGTPSLASLTLVGPGIVGFGAASDSLTINAGHVVLDNSAGASLVNTGTGVGSLAINSTATALDDGNIVVAGSVALQGFQSIALSASGRSANASASVAGTGELLFSGSAGASAGLVVGGTSSTLAIDATIVTALRGVDASVTVPGTLTIGNSGLAPAVPQSTELGASLAISAQNVDISGRIDLPAGVVQIDATGPASTDGITLENGSLIRVAGLTQSFASSTADVSAGTISLSSTAGSILENSGATLDISGAGTAGDAGTLAVSAPMGTATLAGNVLAQAGTGAQGANFSVDAASIASLASLVQTFATATGGTSANSVDIRARTGNLVLASGETLKAAAITLEADGGNGATDGSITLAGTLDASGANGGTVALYGNDQVVLQSGALIDAHATAAQGSGGDVLISSRVVASPASTLDAIVLQGGSEIDVTGGAQGTGGSVTLRAPRVGSDVAITAAAGTVVGTRSLDGTQPLDPGLGVQNSVIIDAVQVYAETGAVTLDASLASGVLATAQADSQSYAAAASAAGTGIDTTRLALDINLRPEIEVDTPGAISVVYPQTNGVVGPLDFAATDGSGSYLWRYGGSTLSTSTPGALTLRAGGGINVDTGISDGFVATSPASTVSLSSSTPLTLNPNVATSGESWSYTLTAGADLSAANPNRIVAGSGADLTIGTQSSAQPVTIRTGTGSISLNASQDVILNNGAKQQSNVVYTAGVGFAPAGVTFPTLLSFNAQGVETMINVQLTQYGGNLAIHAGSDVYGVAQGINLTGSTQNVSDWLLRGGEGSPAAPGVWWVDFANFQQGFGALGGGNLTLTAGANVAQVGAVVASNAYDVGAGISERNAGNLTVTAGGTLQQGMYYDQAGALQMRASVIAPTDSTINLGPQENLQIAQGSGVVNVQARVSATLDAPFNPTLITPSTLETGVGGTGTRLTLKNSPEYQTAFLSFGQNSNFDARVAAGDLTLGLSPVAGTNVIAPTVQAVSFGGSLTGSNLILGQFANSTTGFILAPSPTGQFVALADGSITGLSVLMSQADPSVVPSIAAPGPDANVKVPVTTPLYLDSGNGGASLHADDPTVAQIIARNGSIIGDYFDIPKTTQIIAAGDIGGSGATTIFLQNSNASSLSTISAGQNIEFVSVPGSFDGITIGGPGALQIVAGGAINLGSSGTGVVSAGNLVNSNLAGAGASLIVVAGAGRSANGFAALPDYTGVIDDFIAYDAFASTGTAAAGLDQQVVAAVAADPSLQPLAAALKAGLADRAGSLGNSNSTFAQDLAQLTPVQLATGGVRLASAIQVVNNQLFVNSNNSDTFAPAYLAFADLFPAVGNYAAAIRSFVLDDIFANAANGATLRTQTLQGLPAALVNVIDLGLVAPASVNESGSSFSTALAALEPSVLSSGTRQLYANVLSVAGASEAALKASGSLVGSGSPYAKQLTAFAQALSPATPQGVDDLQMDYSQIKAESTGDVAFFDPQGAVIVGQSSPPAFTSSKTPDNLGIFTYGGGDIIGMSRDSINVFQSRVFTVAGGDIDLWSSLEDLDAGRGPRDVAVVPPPRLIVNSAGVEALDVSSTVTGSGIGALETEPNQPPSNINLMAPAGYVDAGEAGIRASTGTVVLGTNLVLNAGNIQAASGVSGGAVVATPPPPPPPSTGTSASDRIVEEAQREAVAQAQSAAVAASQRQMRIVGEFIGFDECSDSTKADEDCPPAKTGGGSR
jgi:filamentous hemagglutinin family protein